MLAGDVDRERTVETLKGAYTEGRLTDDELRQRSGLAYQARTHEQLYGLTADIPRPPRPLPRPPAPPPSVNAKAVAALVCGVTGVLGLLVTGIPAIVLGHLARREIRRTGERGDAMAVCGLVLGYVLTALVVAVVTLVTVVVWGVTRSG